MLLIFFSSSFHFTAALIHYPEKSKENFSDQCSSVGISYNQRVGVYYITKCCDLLTDQIKSTTEMTTRQHLNYIAVFSGKA